MSKTKVVTKGGKVRASFAHVFEPSAMESGGPEKYSCQLIIRKDDKETVKQVKDAIAAAIEEGAVKKKWDANVYDDKAIARGKFKYPLRDGDEEEREEVAGCYFVNASSTNRPVVIDAGCADIDEASGKFYSGCFINASVNFYAFDVSGSKGIACGLNAVQKVRDGESFGGYNPAVARADFDVEVTEMDSDDDADDLM